MRVRCGKFEVAATMLTVAALVVAGVLAAGCGKKSPTASTAPSTPGAQSTAPAGSQRATNTVAVFLLKDETVFQVNRVAGGTGAAEALAELLKGVVGAEKQEGLSTAIPQGTRLNSYKVENGKAVADFSSELKNYGGGSARVQAIINQITNTVTSNDKTVKSVQITIEGVPAEESLQP
jgi:spore germination protein GerM